MQLTTMNVMLFPQVFKYWILLAVQHLHTMDFFRTMLNYIGYTLVFLEEARWQI